MNSTKMKFTKIILILFFAYSSAQAMTKKVAGLMIFRRNNSRIEYLMLKSSKPHGEWSPPKGLLVFIVSTNEIVHITLNGNKPVSRQL